MTIIIKKLKNVFFVPLVVLVLFICSGCSQNIPEIYNTSYSVVFDFKDYEKKPDVRLALFVETSTDPRRCERLEIHSLEKDYVWNTKKIERFYSSDENWAGNVNFVVPDGEFLPKGEYEVKYINADESEVSSIINIRYIDELYDSNANDVSQIMSKNGRLKLAIYDENKVLLFFGDRTEDLSTKGDIFNTFNDAVYYQDVWIENDNTVICILPENKL